MSTSYQRLVQRPRAMVKGATKLTFSCQLSNTLMAWPPPSPPPRLWICEKPVGWGVMLRVVLPVGFDCAMPL